MKSKYIFGGIIILVFLGLMGYLLTQTNISYENNFTKIINTSKTIKATGAWVKEKGYQVDKEHGLITFYMKDNNGTEMKVVYKGSVPNNFESSKSLVVTGKFKDGYFQATDILTKCPSKYQETYDATSNS